MRNGILIVYKEKGFTSHDVVAKLRGICKQKKIGHTGTLDPDATGVLPVCLGRATKVCDMLTDSDKTYETVMHLGITTDTQDITGEVLKECPIAGLTEEDVKSAIKTFVGEYQQVPPMYSALKVDGQKLCDLARKGIEVERKSRTVQIYDIEISKIELPYVSMRVSCSKGTYIRTLCHDIGEKLNVGACMEQLCRVKAAGFSIEDAKTLSEIQKTSDCGDLDKLIIPVDKVFEEYPCAYAKDEFEILYRNGNPLDKTHFVIENVAIDTPIRVYSEQNDFIGIYEYKEEKHLFCPVKMFLI